MTTFVLDAAVTLSWLLGDASAADLAKAARKAGVKRFMG